MHILVQGSSTAVTQRSGISAKKGTFCAQSAKNRFLHENREKPGFSGKTGENRGPRVFGCVPKTQGVFYYARVRNARLCTTHDPTVCTGEPTTVLCMNYTHDADMTTAELVH